MLIKVLSLIFLKFSDLREIKRIKTADLIFGFVRDWDPRPSSLSCTVGVSVLIHPQCKRQI